MVFMSVHKHCFVRMKILISLLIFFVMYISYSLWGRRGASSLSATRVLFTFATTASAIPRLFVSKGRSALATLKISEKQEIAVPCDESCR